uniref:Zinc finger protein RFP-like n=1 Tax=Calidris pygmaea TaxID=425635 RepID=A0A8C3PQP8_9CHAR
MQSGFVSATHSCCSICLEIFQDPVFIHCGHSFCRSCITRTWEGLTTNFCPQCRETEVQKNLRPNRELANVIEVAKRLNVPQVREVEGGENLCKKHQEPLKLFCQEDKRLICVVCDRSEVHHNHSVVPVDEAAQEYKVRGLWERTEAAKQKVVMTYRKIHKLLEKQESSFLAQLEHELNACPTKPSHEIKNMVKEALLPPKIDLTFFCLLSPVSHLGPTTRQCLEGSQPRERTDPLPPMSAAMSLTLSPSPAGMTLDPETANARLYLSEDCKFVRWVGCEQDLPSNPERFKIDPCVLGSRGFTSGWHHWDVEICREGFWAVGVVKESVTRKVFLDLNPNKGIWALCHDHGECVACTSPDLTFLTLRSVPKRMRISLDYEEGRVVLFDAESKERIFAFLQVSFQGERPLLSCSLHPH